MNASAGPATDRGAEASRLLHAVFGYDAFRPLQGEIVDCVTAGGDALVLMPTGGGKSLCYQIPAILRDGTGIVVSPLIALMQDQVAALRQAGVRAAFLNSTLDRVEAAAIEQSLLAGDLDLLYVAPERLLMERTMALLERTRIALFAIDEAHCVSQWGHDFRPEYIQLSILHDRFPDVPRIALTATADTPTRNEIVERLGLGSARRFIGSFDRPNIRYRINAADGNARDRLLRFIRAEHDGEAGIVYCLSRRGVDEAAAWLRERGLEALPYHAGLDAGERQRNQERFLRGDGVIIVATIAFGMGIDKPDIRFVAHLNLPRSLESYYQETGRAGRDGLAADAWMVYGLRDVITLRQMQAASEADESRKRVERQKLEAMLGFCELTTCRRQALLRYFGEDRPEPCGNCDTCLDTVSTWDATVAAQKALSCVHRTGQRFGVGHVIDVLSGRMTERVARLGHDRLSTFAVGAEHSAAQWRTVFRQLIAHGLLEVDIEGYGGLRLTTACRPVLRGEERLLLRESATPAVRAERRRGKAIEFDSDDDRALWEALRRRRSEVAERQGVPAYVIFHDATLREMVNRRPATMAAMAEISGVGTRKLEAYGEEFLSLIAAELSGSG